MLNRSELLTVFLIAANVGVGTKTYQLWKDGPWEIPSVTDAPVAEIESVDQKIKATVELAREVETKTIVDRNLFDPERGTEREKIDKAAEAIAAAAERLRSMVLVGTAVLGESRYAIVEDPGDARARSPRPELQPAQRGEMRRLKLGDALEGFKLSAVEDRKIVFVNGSSQVELALDYFRKISDGSPSERSSGPNGAQIGRRPLGQPMEPVSPAAPLAPRFPRRDARQR